MLSDLITIIFLFAALWLFNMFDTIQSYCGKYIVGQRGQGKTALATAEALKVMKDKKRLVKSNKLTAMLKSGGYKYLEPTKQLVYADYRLTKNNYWNDRGHCERTVSNFISGYEIGTLNTSNPLFKRTIVPCGHIALDEVNKYYNSRLSTDFPDEVGMWHQTCRHNDITTTMTAQRAMDVDAKIREIIDVYQEIQFMWVFKWPFSKKIIGVVWRVYEWRKYDEYMMGKKPIHIFKRMLNWLFWLPSHSARRTFIHWGNIFKHYDSQYHRPLFFNPDSRFIYKDPPRHRFTLTEYSKYRETVQADRPLEFMRETKREKKKRLQGKNK